MKANRNKTALQFSAEKESQISQQADVFSDRVSLAELRKIWNGKNRQYTDDELYRIREWLYVLADVVVNVIENKDPEVLQAISKRARKKPVKECLLFFTQDKPKAA